MTCGQVWPHDKASEARLLKGFLRHQISGILFATGRYLMNVLHPFWNLVKNMESRF